MIYKVWKCYIIKILERTEEFFLLLETIHHHIPHSLTQTSIDQFLLLSGQRRGRTHGYCTYQTVTKMTVSLSMHILFNM